MNNDESRQDWQEREIQLWRRWLQESRPMVQPLNVKPRVDPGLGDISNNPPPPSTLKPQKKPKPIERPLPDQTVSPAEMKTTLNTLTSLAPPAVSPKLNSQVMRQIRQRKRRADAMVDLHGLSEQQAHERLGDFLQSAATHKHKLLLIITGKGRGALQSAVPKWLDSPAFSRLVHSYDQALPEDGGEGAFYVMLRRR